MRPRTLRRLACAFLALLVLWGVREALNRRRPRETPLWRSALEAERLSIADASGEVVLIRDGKVWRLEEPFRFPADGRAVKRLLKKLSSARLSQPVAGRSERHAKFHLNRSSAVRFRGWIKEGAEPDLSLLAGRPGVGWDTFFVRRPGDAAVLEARGMARHELDAAPDAWADLVVCELDPARATSLTIRGSTWSVSLARREGIWFRQGAGEPLPREAAALVDSALTALARLSADAVRPESAVHPFVLRGLKTPELTIEVGHVGKGQVEPGRDILELQVGPRKPGFKHPVRKTGLTGFVYEMSPQRLDVFRLTPEKLAGR